MQSDLNTVLIHSLVLVEVLIAARCWDCQAVRPSMTYRCTGHREYYYFSMLQEPATSLMPLKLRTGGGPEGHDSR